MGVVASGDQRGELLTLSRQMVQSLLAEGSLSAGLQKLPRLRELSVGQLPLLDSDNRVKVQFSQGLPLLLVPCPPWPR